ncbi:MAG TPA: Uma2 family endonuclease [Urbifossiella sp.]|nr:Uma2 family endonuclease [Urbifossiella sp.]
MNAVVSPPRTGKIPPLQNGDRLSRDEFERRYRAMPHVKKAELIEGEVYMPSPVSWQYHGAPHMDVALWLGTYRASTPGTDAADNSTVRLDIDNELQPDAVMIVKPEYGGRVEFDADGYLSGSPELVFEVSASTAAIDLNRKLNVYRRNRVSEYLVWRVYDEAVDWFVFREGEFERKGPDADGIFRSAAFPGLWLDPAALVRRDAAAVLTVLHRGLASPEHAAFVQQLAARHT